MINVALAGACGKMGNTVYKTITDSDEFNVVFGVDPYDSGNMPFPIFENFEKANLDCDCIIDFSKASSIDDILKYSTKNKKPLVIATTGHNETQNKSIEKASKSIAIFRASNMSLGVKLLTNLAKEATKVLGDDYDIEIVEMHHKLKLDAPSGTALTLANAINSVKNNEYELKYGRKETAHRRDKKEIGMHSLRGGTVVGKHDVVFLGAGEEITLSHTAESKEVFAIGALRAASFIINKAPGLYNMDDIMGGSAAVTNVVCEDNVALINLPKTTFEKFLQLLDVVQSMNINVDMISQTLNNDGTIAASFSLNDDDVTKVITKIPPTTPYLATRSKGKITAQGAGMTHQSGVALNILTMLKGLGIKVIAITTSETEISCCIDKNDLNKAKSAIKNHYHI